MARTSTANRTLIMEHLSSMTRFVSAQTLYASMKAAGSTIGLATVYRNLQGLADENLLDIKQTDTEVLYRLCRTDEHHHHLVCDMCGETVEIEGHIVEEWAKQLEKETGFARVDHILEFSGLCPNCAKK